MINPDYESVISSTILSLNTKRCLKNIAKVFIKINRGMFFESNLETDYTIFNHYILDVIGSINQFYDKLIDVALPRNLDSLIKGNENVNIDYFSSHRDELIHFQSICFSLGDVLTIVKRLKPYSEKFKDDKIYFKSIEKINNQKNILNDHTHSEGNRNFFLIFNTINNHEMEIFLYPQAFKFTFNDGIESNDFRLKQIKFCIKLILRSLNMLNVKVYSHFANSNTTEKFFDALNQIIQLEEFNEVEFHEKIPINWYSLYMMSNIGFLSDEYKKDDYAKLYQEIITEERKEIEFLNQKNNMIVTRYGLNMRCIEKIIENIKRYHRKVINIEQHLRIEYFLKNTSISVCVRLNSKEDHEESKSGIFDFLFGKLRKNTVINDDEEDMYNFIKSATFVLF
jgi:hypothetical protein